jgi:8-oxo-dGTP pyrophosphatase MutT (NUDIX family)
MRTITSACALVINPEGLVLSVSRRDDHNDFGLPGGKSERSDHSGIDTAIRETWEEARVKLFPEHLVHVYSGMGRKFYCATYLATKYDDSEMGSSSEEGIVKWLDFAAVLPGTFHEYNTRLLREVMRMLGSHPNILHRNVSDIHDLAG